MIRMDLKQTFKYVLKLWIIISIILFFLFSISEFFAVLDPLSFLYYIQEYSPQYKDQIVYTNFFYYPGYESIIHPLVSGLLLSIVFYMVRYKTELGIKQKVYKNQYKFGLLGASVISLLAVGIIIYSESKLSGGAAAQAGLEPFFLSIISIFFIGIITGLSAIYGYYIIRKDKVKKK